MNHFVMDVLGLWFGLAYAGQETAANEEVRFSCGGAEVAGTLFIPSGHRPVACAVLIGGSMSHTRDGELQRKGVPSRSALKLWATVLSKAGYASLRYDKPGYGRSKTTSAWQGSYADEAGAAAAAIRLVRGRKELSKIIVVGESAGAYLACLAAKNGVSADAYVFLGGLCGPGESLYEYTFGGLVRHAESGADRLAWAEKHARQALALGRTYKAMLAAAAEGKTDFEMIDGGFRGRMGGLARRREELRFPPDEMFRHIQAPALTVAGAKDLNVPPEHAARAAAIMRSAGNRDVSSCLIPGADHSFQQAPVDLDQRFQERFTFASFKRPYEPKAFQQVIAWLQKTAPVARTAEAPQGRIGPAVNNNRARDKPEFDAKTDTSPERLQLAPGIEIIDDITDRNKTAGVETLEGRIGPLLLAEGSQAHFIDMPPGMYVEEHPHSKESIIYTVRGRWVLCSKDRRHVMKAGSLFRFGKNIPTGYEVPFDDNAFILILKGQRLSKDEKEFIDYLKGFAERLKKAQKNGVPFLLSDLPRDHPARKFARQVNPKFETGLNNPLREAGTSVGGSCTAIQPGAGRE